MNVLGILVGSSDDVEETKRISNLFDDCPYKIINKVIDDNVILFLYIPEGHIWWLEEIEESPKTTLGLNKVDIFFSENFDFSLNLDGERESEESPCGTNCFECEFYGEKCKGCPSTVYYEEK